MFKQLYALARQLVTLMQDVQKLKVEQKEFRRAFPDDPTRMSPTMHYFMQINAILRGMTKDTLSDKSILIGPADTIIETLKRVEQDGIEEVILYFNVGRKPHTLVKEQMHRFMEEVAPAFDGSHARGAREA